jgi:hypothetical protein
MTDQRIVPTDDGLSLHGSLPPGRVTLVWGYDLPLDGSSITIRAPIAFRTYVLRVEADAPAGMALDVEGLPDPEVHEVDGPRLLITEAQRRPEDPPIERVEIRLRNIPGPGPYRYVAVGAALILLLGAMMFLFRSGEGDARALASSRAERRGGRGRADVRAERDRTEVPEAADGPDRRRARARPALRGRHREEGVSGGLTRGVRVALAPLVISLRISGRSCARRGAR